MHPPRSVLDLIGNTPLLQVKSFDTEPADEPAAAQRRSA